MMFERATRLFPWLDRLAWSVITVLMAHLIGRLLVRTICSRLTVWASRTLWKWDDLVVQALRRGIPIWSLFVGCYIAVGLWPLPEHLLRTLTAGLYLFGWLSATVIAADAAGQVVSLYGGQLQRSMPVTSLTENIARIIVVILGLMMILHGLGISIAPLLTALGVGGLAVALAMQDTLSNLFSGFYLTMTKQIRIGDYVKLDSGEEGYVEDIGWRATSIRMLPNNLVIVPNHKLGQAVIVNYHLPDKELAVVVELGVDYRSDLSQVEQVTSEVGREVMQTVAGGIPGFEPFIRYHTFSDFSIKLSVILRAREFVDQYLIKHEFIKRLHVRYQREGIIIPFPIQRVLTK